MADPLAQSKAKGLTPTISDPSTLERIEEKSQPQRERMGLYAKIEANYHLSNKKALFWNMTNYYQRSHKDPFESLPLTFHVENGLSDHEFVNFKNYFTRLANEMKNKKEELQAAIKAARKVWRKEQKDKETKPTNHTSPLRKHADVATINNSTQKDQTIAQKHAADIPTWYYDTYEPEMLSYLEDEEIQNHYKIKIPRNIWIMKPGENSNQGCGINVSASIQEIT